MDVPEPSEYANGVNVPRIPKDPFSEWSEDFSGGSHLIQSIFVLVSWNRPLHWPPVTFSWHGVFKFVQRTAETSSGAAAVLSHTGEMSSPILMIFRFCQSASAKYL